MIELVHMESYQPQQIDQIPEYAMEDEADYSPLSFNDIQDYDWSPPEGELPDDGFINSAPLSTSLSKKDESEDLLSENWNNQDNNYLSVLPKLDLKRAFEFPRQKKSQVLCRVQRTIHRHNEAGHEFFPKSFTSYSCHPVSQSSDISLITSQDVCLVRSNKCNTLHMQRFFLKRNESDVCWSDILSMEVESGCDCLYHYKYRIHL